jgi:predicted small secreted protein
MVRRGLPLIFVLLLLAAILAGCPTPPAAGGDEPARVTVVVTRDFGRELILAEEVEIGEGTDAMTALQTVAEVETKYGGGFVKAINGLSSQEASQLDWFYYINGISLSLGAKDYLLGDGDLEHWDLRDWSYRQFVPAVIGAFPQPFLNGLRGEVKPTAVVYDAPFAGEAGALAAKLEEWGVAEITLNGAETLPDGVKNSSNLIIVGGAESGLILELNELRQKLGFFACMEGGKITVLDEKGDQSGEYGAGWGLIQATQNPWSPGGVGSGESIVFMVTGADENGVRSAIGALIDNSDGLRYAYAVLVNNNEIIKIP